jgi:ADP-ribose pyrophosphatase YjhB (NUDIX family)
LLGRRRFPPRQGYWDLPGGFLEEGELPEDGLRREFLEETGLAVSPVSFIGGVVDPYDHYFVLGLTYIVTGDGDPVANDDVEELRWFAPADLPTEMAFPSQNTVLAAWAAGVTPG